MLRYMQTLAQLPRDLRAPSPIHLPNWQDEAENKQRIACEAGSDEVCPLSQIRIVELEPKDLFLASDKHVYDRKMFTAYVGHQWTHRDTLPASPLTRRQLRATDVLRLYATQREVVDVLRLNRDHDNAFRLLAYTTPLLGGVLLGVIALHCVHGTHFAHPGKGAVAAGATGLLAAVALVGVWLNFMHQTLVYDIQRDGFLELAHRAANRERTERSVDSLSFVENQAYARALRAGTEDLRRTGWYSIGNVYALERHLEALDHESRLKFAAATKADLARPDA